MALLQTDTAEGALKGMILARAPHQLDDQEVAYLQDAIINQPGFVKRRGAITGTTAITAANVDSTRPYAACAITDPSGAKKLGIFYLKDTGARHDLYVSVYTVAAGVFTFVQKQYMTSFVLGFPSYPTRQLLIQAVPAIDGSVLVSVRQTYGRAVAVAPYAYSCVARWYGGCSTTSLAVGSLATLTATEGSTSVTGAVGQIALISFPGMVIYGTGVVASVTSTTQVELIYPSPVTYAAVATNYFTADNLPVGRARGRISCTAATLIGVTGYGTKFTEAQDRATSAASGGFSFFDATSMKLLATSGANALAVSDTVSGVPNTVPRSASMKNYLLFCGEVGANPFFHRFEPVPGGSFVTPRSARGSWWATYKGYMVSFNAAVLQAGTSDAGDTATTSRAYIHGPRFPEIMDHSSADGDWFEVQSIKSGDPDGVAVQGGNNCAILCKALETFAITGDDPENFVTNKIADDGALSFESVTSYKGNPIWLGRTGIWIYSGAGDPVNIVEDSLGSRWTTLVAAFDGTSIVQDSDSYLLNQARCFVYKDYLFVNVTNTGSQHSVYTDGVARTSNTMQFCVYMPTGAVSFLTNFNFQCFFQIGNAGYVIFPQLGSTTHHIYPLDNLFTQGTTSDTILTANSYNSGTLSSSVGPWFHMESRKYSAGDGLRRKVWKQLSIESQLTSTKRLFLETVPGLNTTGTRQVTPYVGTGLYLAFKNKFNARDQYMSFRLYEDIANRPATMSLGAWQWAFKQARKGQV